MRSLSGSELREMRRALMSAFPSPEDLKQLLLDIDKRWAVIVPANANLGTAVFEILEDSEAEGWTDELIIAACAARPGNPYLAAVAEPIGLAPKLPGGLEQLITKHGGLHDVARLREGLWLTEARVCHVESPTRDGATVTGTAFLVGRDLALTSFHVVQHLDAGRGDPAAMRLRFDFKRLEDGTTLNPGVVHGLATDWLVSSSPPSAFDEGAAAGVPSTDELDYALLRLDSPVGDARVSPTGVGRGEPRRGWVALRPDVPEPEPGTIVAIVQHPDGRPMKLAADVAIGVNENATRLRYQTDTLPGSSGAPCFDLEWRLLAVHQSGDPRFAITHQAEHNQGIPIRAICAQLAAEGLLDDLEPPVGQPA
jgi:hypothetical protein